MSRKQVSVREMRNVIADLGDVFATKDVSEDERMIKAHLQLVKHSQYHAFVGGALSDHRAELDIKEIQKNTSRGSRWQKTGFSLKEIPKFIQTNEQELGTLGGKLDRSITLVCPSCGGKLQSTKEKDRFRCPHCANEHIIKIKDDTYSEQFVSREIQSMQDEILNVKRSVNINNAELAIARINKELPLIRSELRTLETLCVYNNETTDANNLVYRAKEK